MDGVIKECICLEKAVKKWKEDNEARAKTLEEINTRALDVEVLAKLTLKQKNASNESLVFTLKNELNELRQNQYTLFRALQRFTRKNSRCLRNCLYDV